MFPYISIFSLEIPTYGLISLIGILVAGSVSLKLASNRGIDKADLGVTAIWAGIGLFVGAHLLYGITRMDDVIEAFRDYSMFDGFFDFAKHILELFSGMVFYGGLYGGLLAGVIAAKNRRLNIGDTRDVFAVFVPLFHVFGRVGCFFAGCCYGVPSQFGICGRVVTKEVTESFRRFPVQLLEALLLLVLFFVILMLFQKGRFKGNLMFLYLLVYAVLRFCLEFLRGDEIRGKLLMFSTSQWISIITLLWVSIYLIVRKCRKNNLKV